MESGLDELNGTLEAIGGCGDGDCKVYVRPGMHTNGGCRCLRNDKYKAERVISAYRRYVRFAEATRAPSDAALVEALEERVELLQSALLEIAEKDWHARTPPKPRADGGMRGWAGHLAVWALTGLHGSYSGDDAVRAALAAAKGQQP